MWAHRSMRFREPGRGLKKGEARFLAWLLTTASFPFICWVAGVPVRENFLIGVVAGVASPVVIALLKMASDKTGWPLDLDKLLGMDEDTEGGAGKPV